MKKYFLSIFIALSCFQSAFAAQGDTLRVLAIGNSFSQDAVEQNLREIAEAQGKVIYIGNMYIGGCSLSRHWWNVLRNAKDYRLGRIGDDGRLEYEKGYSIEQVLRKFKWDVISFQQNSGHSGIEMTYEPYLAKLLEYFRNHSGQGVRFMFHQTWAYEQTSTHQDFVFYHYSQKEMYEAIMKCSRRVCEKHKLELIPCGTAIQNLRNSYIGDRACRDGYHLNLTFGRYTAAATWFAALFGERVSGNPYCPEGVTPEQLGAAQKAADAAVAKPYSVTSS